MTDQEAQMFRALLRRYGPYKVALELRRALDGFVGAKWAPAKRRAKTLEYFLGMAEGRLRRLGA